MQGYGYVTTVHTLLAICQRILEFTYPINSSTSITYYLALGTHSIDIKMIPARLYTTTDNAIHTSYGTSLRLLVQQVHVYVLKIITVF